MKKPYVSPNMRLAIFDVEDVITASSGGDTPATDPGLDLEEFALPGDAFIITYD